MKILIFSNDFYSLKKVSGGREKYIYNLVKRLRNHHEIILVLPHFHNIKLENVKVYNYRSPDIPYLKFLVSAISILFYLPYIIIKEKPDVISAFIPSSDVFLLFVIGKIFRKVNILNLRGVWKKGEYKIILKDGLAILPADAFVMNAKSLNKDLADRLFFLPKSITLGKKAYYIPNAIDTDFWRPVNVQEKNADIVYLANIGSPLRLYLKGFENLYRALKIIEKKYGKVLKAKIIGNYDKKLILSKLDDKEDFHKFFIWKGKITSKNQIKKEICESKIFVLSSNSEGMPNALMEAMSLEMPCIAMDVGAVSELIKDNFNGFLIEKGNVEMLSTRIWQLVNDEDLQEKLGKNARKYIKKYDWTSNIKMVETCYKKILIDVKNKKRSNNI